MYNSPVSFFVRTLTSDIDTLIEESFYLSYYVGIQPSEVDKLSTREYRKYLHLMEEHVEAEKEYNKSMAQVYGARQMLGGAG